jgi:diguanylate cyclase (GGDEF)-like protein/PAS domain S-box-containing protein
VFCTEGIEITSFVYAFRFGILLYEERLGRTIEPINTLSQPLAVSLSPELVFVSILLSIAASYTAFASTDRMQFSVDIMRCRLWWAGGSVAMGTGIWSMHYLGMLAVNLPADVYYHVPTVTLSLFAGIASSSVALKIVSLKRPTWTYLWCGGTVMGVGIGIMHYLGMAAMRSDAMPVYSTRLIVVSFVAGALLATLSLSIGSRVQYFVKRAKLVRVAAAILMGLAIASVHYIAMTSSHFMLQPMGFSTRNTIHIQALGEICVMLSAVLISMLVMRLASYDKRLSLDGVRQAAMNLVQERYRLATQSNQSGIWDWDRVLGKMHFSARCREIVGLPAVDTEGDLEPWLARFHPADLKRAYLQLDSFSTEGRHEFTNEYRIRHEDGRWIWTASGGTAVCGPGGNLLRMAASITDITEVKSTDPLTGVHNRRSLLDCVDQQIAAVSSGRQFALLSIGLDDFTRINAGFGQLIGDMVLVEVAGRLKSTASRKDGLVIARTGGNDFVVLVGEVEERRDVEDLALFLQGVLLEPMICSSQELSISASIGISFGSSSTIFAEGLLEDADVARTQARTGGNGKFAIFAEEMRERTKDRMKLESDLRMAMPKGELVLYYQPKVRLTTGETVGFEALVRWKHSERGLISPAEFIPCAEESGLIVEMDRWTMREAVRQLKKWRDDGRVESHVTVAVNLSAQQFEDGLLSNVVQAILSEEELPASFLTLELTESALVRNSTRAKEMLVQLRQLGVGLDLDDFGTGFSSLSYLHRFPFSTLKIDQSFVRDLHLSKESRAIAQSILTLGSTLNMVVIAEGVETAEQVEILLNLGCEYGQGYFYSRPQPPAEIEKLMV